MTAFIIKSGICMVLLFGLYWFFLRKEKLLNFSRYYLIFSVLLSIAVPFISVPIDSGYNKATSDILTILNNQPELKPEQNSIALPIRETALSGNIVSESTLQSAVVQTRTRTIDISRILIFVYLSGFALMLIRFCRNILLVFQMSRRSEKIDHEWYKIALLDCPVNPYSFLRTVFLNKRDYLENRIGANVLSHELEHVRQSHSRDVIFFEMLHIVFWFNPVLFLYKWAARVNHEYLADEAVIRNISDMKTYAEELINFVSRRASVSFTSGFSPSMIRLRLLMLNKNTTRSGKYTRVLITLITSVLLMSFLSVRPSNNDTQNRKTKKEINKDIVIEEVHYRDPDFKALKALVVIDGRKLGIDEVVSVDPARIKNIDILSNREAKRKYGRIAKSGVVEITTYEGDKKSVPDTLSFKPIYTVNNIVPVGTITIPVSNLFSWSMWTYPIFPNQDMKRWRTIDIMTRDFYKIRGTVIQKDGKPLPGVLLTATDNPYQVRTDKLGHFLLVDVKPDVIAELSADGFEPFYFKVNESVFTNDLKITLDKKGESGDSKISINYNIKDFSGIWKLNTEATLEHNKELKNLPPVFFNSVFNIRQFDSDSILLNRQDTVETGREYKSSRSYVFNTVKTEPLTIDSNIKSTLTCSISADGQSFSITQQVKSKLGIFEGYKSTETYTLSDDEKQMIIHRYFTQGDSTDSRSSLVMIYDKI